MTMGQDTIGAGATVTMGGFQVAVLDRQAAARTMVEAASTRRGRPFYFTPHSPSKSLILLSGSQYFRYKSWC
jgi:hypothetical protein